MSSWERTSSRRLRNKLRLLVLDEHPGCRRMMSFVIASRGHTCITVDTVDEAFAALDEFRADAVIYDWNRRQGALLGFAREVKLRYRSVRGVLVTSSIDEPPQFQVAEHVDSYFTKPLAIGEVVTRAELIVRSRRE